MRHPVAEATESEVEVSGSTNGGMFSARAEEEEWKPEAGRGRKCGINAVDR
jgi:hypothetical protein